MIEQGLENIALLFYLKSYSVEAHKIRKSIVSYDFDPIYWLIDEAITLSLCGLAQLNSHWVSLRHLTVDVCSLLLPSLATTKNDFPQRTCLARLSRRLK